MSTWHRKTGQKISAVTPPASQKRPEKSQNWSEVQPLPVLVHVSSRITLSWLPRIMIPIT